MVTDRNGTPLTEDMDVYFTDYKNHRIRVGTIIKIDDTYIRIQWRDYHHKTRMKIRFSTDRILVKK